MLAYSLGAADTLLAEVAIELRARKIAVAGAVQIVGTPDKSGKSRMELRLLPDSECLCISQDLGPLASGCRLDPAALEYAVGQVSAELSQRPALLILNKFGKSEAEGRGFRPLIGEALMNGIPALTCVSTAHLDAFTTFAGDMATCLPPDKQVLLDWCLAQTNQNMFSQSGDRFD